MLGDKIERKLGFIRIPNLMFIIVVISGFVFLIDYVSVVQGGRPILIYALHFKKELILKGQIWRAIGFVFTQLHGNLFFVFIEAYFLYFMGTSLEASVGTRRFSLFYIFGVLFAVITGFLTGRTTVTFLNMTMFFAFATINPNMKILLFFFIPVNTIIIGLLDAVYFFVTILVALIRRDVAVLLAAAAALVNFLIFFGPRFFLDLLSLLKSFQQKSKRMYQNGSYWGS